MGRTAGNPIHTNGEPQGGTSVPQATTLPHKGREPGQATSVYGQHPAAGSRPHTNIDTQSEAVTIYEAVQLSMLRPQSQLRRTSSGAKAKAATQHVTQSALPRIDYPTAMKLFGQLKMQAEQIASLSGLSVAVIATGVFGNDSGTVDTPEDASQVYDKDVFVKTHGIEQGPDTVAVKAVTFKFGSSGVCKELVDNKKLLQPLSYATAQDTMQRILDALKIRIKPESQSPSPTGRTSPSPNTRVTSGVVVSHPVELASNLKRARDDGPDGSYGYDRSQPHDLAPHPPKKPSPYPVLGVTPFSIQVAKPVDQANPHGQQHQQKRTVTTSMARTSQVTAEHDPRPDAQAKDSYASHIHRFELSPKSSAEAGTAAPNSTSSRESSPTILNLNLGSQLGRQGPTSGTTAASSKSFELNVHAYDLLLRQEAVIRAKLKSIAEIEEELEPNVFSKAGHQVASPRSINENEHAGKREPTAASPWAPASNRAAQQNEVFGLVQKAALDAGSKKLGLDDLASAALQALEAISEQHSTKAPEPPKLRLPRATPLSVEIPTTAPIPESRLPKHHQLQEIPADTRSLAADSRSLVADSRTLAADTGSKEAALRELTLAARRQPYVILADTGSQEATLLEQLRLVSKLSQLNQLTGLTEGTLLNNQLSEYQFSHWAAVKREAGGWESPKGPCKAHAHSLGAAQEPSSPAERYRQLDNVSLLAQIVMLSGMVSKSATS